ncbi:MULTISPECIES: DUF2065 domain-containing protein [Ancylobacter]|uniref:Uncharacterized protein YjeT (DUF2065 family) n=1 Tax=Ancylobacter vacuolatus TaxID=223389 RepID=A0ABU0DJ56_9HYPH|nr:MULTISPECIES: DUF2065 domain-containing protein [Ancylobacter]MDQ0348452.1 uncharacterized protein YjeT (DUF2065 family) [Ancylobacter vacuolatus]
MYDLIVALGLVLVIEGLVLAAAPAAVRRSADAITQLTDSPLRVAGIVGAILGLAIVWLIRG